MSRQTEYSREKRQYLKSLGLCVSCKQDAVEGKTLCLLCSAKSATRYRYKHRNDKQKALALARISRPSRRRNNREAGLCTCGAERIEGRSYCQKCKEYQTKSKKKQYQKRVAKGLCGCGKKRDDPKFRMCSLCRKKDKQQRMIRLDKRQKGLT